MPLKVITTFALPRGGWDLRSPIELKFAGLAVAIEAPPPGTDPRENIGAIAQVASELDDPVVEAEVTALVTPVIFEKLSMPLQAASNAVLHEHAEAMRTAVQVLRWRLGAVGDRRELASNRGTVWQRLGGATGRPFPVKISVSTSAHVLVAPTAAQRTEIESLLTSGRREPLGHSLLREAREQIDTNPRIAWYRSGRSGVWSQELHLSGGTDHPVAH